TKESGNLSAVPLLTQLPYVDSPPAPLQRSSLPSSYRPLYRAGWLPRIELQCRSLKKGKSLKVDTPKTLQPEGGERGPKTSIGPHLSMPLTRLSFVLLCLGGAHSRVR